MPQLIKLLFAMAVLTLCCNPNTSVAQECEELKQQIRIQRNLLKKKTLLTEALERCGGDAEVQYLSAYTSERLRKYDKALTHYLKAAELDPTYAKAFFGLGDIYMVLGNGAAAIRAYENGLRIAPDDTRASSSLELARIKQRSASGGEITSAEFIRVMQESKSQETTSGALDGPIVRMQILFYIDSSRLTERSAEQLEIVGKALENPALAQQKFEISGHTDSSGDPELNLQLSKLRAEQVKEYLVNNFAIVPENLVVAFFGDTRPAVPNTTTENRALNRRVEFKKLSE
ncbi:MAG: OmpA family protein [Desulfuromonadales bacterium]|nr:OmpA family protein [Desulfuromonadales bacterium]MBN2790997.1 OmpA family protein [Desulfuromonadales bacterium]